MTGKYDVNDAVSVKGKIVSAIETEDGVSYNVKLNTIGKQNYTLLVDEENIVDEDS